MILGHHPNRLRLRRFSGSLARRGKPEVKGRREEEEAERPQTGRAGGGGGRLVSRQTY